jgi:ganglioside GM2 activator
MDFEWSNCDDSHSTITKLEVGPDPVNLPGSVSVGLDGVLAKDIVSGSPFKIRIKKKIAFFWINVPCKDGSGSCDYEDFCTKWPIPTPCPDAYVKAKIPCTCPIKAGHYVMPFSNLGYLNEPGLPHWLENGEYKLQALVTSKDDGKSLLCFNLHLHIKAL